MSLRFEDSQQRVNRARRFRFVRGRIRTIACKLKAHSTRDIDADNEIGALFNQHVGRQIVQDAAIDKQVVVRMVAPADRADEIRKVANDIRGAVR